MMSFNFWKNYLLIASLVFTIHSLYWAFFGSFDPLGLWDRLAAEFLFGTSPFSDEVEAFKQFVLAPFGATTAGFFVMVLGLVKFGLERRERWAYWTIIAGLSVWFVVDSWMSLVHGAYFNVVLVNIPCIVVMGIPLLAIRKDFAAP